VAQVAQLRGELPVHRYRLGQSPLPHALCHGGDDASVVVQFRTSVLDVATSALYRVDRSERIGSAAGILLAGNEKYVTETLRTPDGRLVVADDFADSDGGVVIGFAEAAGSGAAMGARQRQEGRRRRP